MNTYNPHYSEGKPGGSPVPDQPLPKLSRLSQKQIINKILGARLRWLGPSLACMGPWVQSPVVQKQYNTHTQKTAATQIKDV
jgi:hypothetical protein